MMLREWGNLQTVDKAGNGEAGLGEQQEEIQKFILDMVGLNIPWRCQGGISNLQEKQEPEF